MHAFFFQWDIVLVLAALLACGLIAAVSWLGKRPARIVVGTVAVLGALALSMVLMALWVLW